MRTKLIVQVLMTAAITSLLGHLINQLPAVPDFPYKNQIIVGTVIVMTLIAAAIAFWQNSQSEEQTAMPEQPQQGVRSRDERELLRWVKEEQIGKALARLHTNRPIVLRKQLQPDQVNPLVTTSSKPFSKSRAPLLESSTILEIFARNDIAGKLLILGEPGSGKTITLLELAQGLVQNAEANLDNPLPVLFNLSFWKDPRQLIPDWLVEQLNSYGIPKRFGKAWVDNCQILPLLDGLDEMKPELQISCV